MKIAEFHRDIFTQVFVFHRYIYHLFQIVCKGLCEVLHDPKKLKDFLVKREREIKVNEILNKIYKKFSPELRLIPLIYNESHSQERYERYCVNKPKSECVVKVVIYFLFKFFLGSMACTYKEQLSCLTHCLSAKTCLMAGKLKMLARFIDPFSVIYSLKHLLLCSYLNI